MLDEAITTKQQKLHRKANFSRNMTGGVPEEYPDNVSGEEKIDARSFFQMVLDPEGQPDSCSLETEPEPEADVIKMFRECGLRFIRRPMAYRECNCKVPQALLDWNDTLEEISGLPREMSIGSTFRWGELKQDFSVDTYGDYHFQDFLLLREVRDPQHATIHFAGIFANIGWDGKRWYFLPFEDFTERSFDDKLEFAKYVQAYVRSCFSQAKQEGNNICPFPNINAHMYVREADPVYEKEDNLEVSEGTLDENLDLQFTMEYEQEYIEVDGEQVPLPKRLSYASLYQYP